MTEETTDATVTWTKEEESKPMKMEITNLPKEKEDKNPTSEDTKDLYEYDIPTDEEIKEMTDAQ